MHRRPRWRSYSCAGPQPRLVDRAAAAAAGLLQRVGLRTALTAGPVRRLGRLLLAPGRGPRVVVIAAGAGRGLRLQVLPETPMTYALGIHERETQTILERELKPGMVVYDCGANVGYFAVICARLVGSGGRVIAFEPSPGSVAALQAAPTLNDLLQLEVVARGLWRESGIVEFTRGAPGASLASDHVHGILDDAESSVATIRVPVVSLDTFVYDDGGPPPDFVKIDVEGAEGALLAGARRLLREQRPRILIEVHGEPGREAWRELRDAGYTCTDLATGRDPQSDDEFAGWLRQYLAVPRI